MTPTYFTSVGLTHNHHQGEHFSNKRSGNKLVKQMAQPSPSKSFILTSQEMFPGRISIASALFAILPLCLSHIIVKKKNRPHIWTPKLYFQKWRRTRVLRDSEYIRRIVILRVRFARFSRNVRNFNPAKIYKISKKFK